jgi:protein gp37
MNKQKPGGIEWCDYTWNPIRGACPVGCAYCYARSIYNRFKLDPTPRLDEKELSAPVDRFTKAKGRIPDVPVRIFVCSTFDLFAAVADKWRDRIFRVIESDTFDTFIILTKLPERIDRPMPSNVWLGVSVTDDHEWRRFHALLGVEARVRFVSMEPMLGVTMPQLRPDWMIIGRLTGHGKRFDPSRNLLESIRVECAAAEIPLFEKSNLAGLVDSPLIQEWPR